jgi:hypothetical protein
MQARPDNTASDSPLWELTRNNLPIEATRLIRAIASQVESGDLDFRTRVLIRDSLAALRDVRGEPWLAEMLEHSGQCDTIKKIASETVGDVGFRSLGRRLMAYQDPEVAREFLRELGRGIHSPAKVIIGGSTALMFAGLLSRRTDDIDVVDELPASIRSEQDLLNTLQARYDLRLAHFQSHYLPDGWEARIQSLGRFDSIEAFIIDGYDIAVGKLFSKRDKDLDDLRSLKQSLDREAFASRFASAGKRLLQEPDLRQNAEKNWYILYGESLPA